MAHKNKVPLFLKMADELKDKASRYAAKKSVDFFQEAIIKGGWTDGSFKPYKKTNNPFMGSKTLHNEGTLLKAFRVTERTTNKVVVENDRTYAEINNNGGFIVVTVKMKRFFWAKHKELKNTNKRKAEFCKAMALKKAGSKIKIPKRQFMGHSETLMSRFDDFFLKQVDIVFKQYLNN